MKKTNKIFAALVLGLTMAFGFTACSDTVNERAQNGYIELDLKWGEEKIEKFVFDLPVSGSNAIYAKKTASCDNANENEYVLIGQNSYDKNEMYVCEVHLRTGDRPEVKVQFRRHYGDSVKFYNLYTINSYEHGLSGQNYHEPMSDGGVFEFNFARTLNDAIKIDMNNSETISQNYPLVRIKAVGTVKTVN